MGLKYYVSICLLIKDENEYLQEWLEHYRSIGVEHFYIYDNGDKEFVDSIITEIDFNNCCTIKRVDKKDYGRFQPDVYKECLNDYKDESYWIGFIDSDEFVDVDSLPNYLKSLENYDTVWLSWIMYGANGYVNKPEGKVQDNFTISFKFSTTYPLTGKMFCQPNNVIAPTNAHNFKSKSGADYIEKNKYIKHYYTKSLEEWKNKINRGSCESKALKHYQEFFYRNPDLKKYNDKKYYTQKF